MDHRRALGPLVACQVKNSDIFLGDIAVSASSQVGFLAFKTRDAKGSSFPVQGCKVSYDRLSRAQLLQLADFYLFAPLEDEQSVVQL